MAVKLHPICHLRLANNQVWLSARWHAFVSARNCARVFEEVVFFSRPPMDFFEIP